MRTWTNETIFNRNGIGLTENTLATLWASIVSIFLIGGAVGSLGGAWINDKLGR